MKLLLLSFVVLTVLNTPCSGRIISRALCEKIPTCKQHVITTTRPAQELSGSSEVDYFRPAIIQAILCPGGAPKLRSGNCSPPSTLTASYEYNVFYDYGDV